ncbi:MAG: sugar transferase [Lachnospiraceae bacterium]|nr:sugar transferase [Lachnospiraceae bacterium]
MKRREAFKRLINLSLAGICLLLEILIFTYIYLKYLYPSLNNILDLNYWFNGYLLQEVVYALMLFFFSKMYGGLRIGFLKNSEIVFSQIFATLIVNLFTYAQMSLMVTDLFYTVPFLEMTLAQMLVIIVWINIANRIYQRVFPPRKLLLIHGDRPIQDICGKFESRKDKYTIIECVNIKMKMDDLKRKIIQGYENGQFSAVVIWDVTVEQRNQLLKFCYSHSIRFYIMPKISDVVLLGAEELHLFDTPILLTREYSMTMEQRFVKRMIDVVCSLILLIVASPFMLITAIAIKVYDGGPVLYKQIRCTEGAREFYIMKFRSMRTDAEKDGVARLAQKHDDRITPIGRFIRKVRIDELPQLINILRGDMSFIGPRPERPEIIAQYVEIMPEFAYRMKVKAGLAGYAQVYGKYNTTPYDKLKLDLTYIENYSLWLDIKLMLLTLKILFWPDSTEGVESEQVTAFKQEYLQQKQRKEAGAEENEEETAAGIEEE